LDKIRANRGERRKQWQVSSLANIGHFVKTGIRVHGSSITAKSLWNLSLYMPITSQMSGRYKKDKALNKHPKGLAAMTGASAGIGSIGVNRFGGTQIVPD
jgi:hypothetical protein